MAYQSPPHGWRTFVIVWVTQSVSVFGSALTFFSITIWLTQALYFRPEQKPELAFALSAISLAFALPTVLIAPLAGAWADRYDRKHIMIVMDLANGCLSLVLVALLATGALQLWSLLVGTLFFAIFGAFHSAAFDTSYAMLVPPEKLPRANGMMQTIWSLSGILSPAIAAFLISLPTLARQGLLPRGFGALLGQLADGTPLAIALDALTFFVASSTLLFLQIPSPKRMDLHTTDGRQKKSMIADVKEGALYIWHRRPLLWLLGTFTVANFAGAPIGVLEPLLVKFNLAADWVARGFTFETALALLTSVGSIGGVISGFLISLWGGLKARRVYGVVIPLIIQGMTLIVFGLSPMLYLTSGMALVCFGMIPLMNAHSQAIWQMQTPHELQGRVFAVRRVIAQCTWPLGTVFAGWAGGLFNPGVVLAVFGGLLTVFCVGQLLNPYLLRVEDKAWLDQMAATRVVKKH